MGAADMLGAAERLTALDTKGPNEGASVGPLKVLGALLGTPVGRPLTDDALGILGAEGPAGGAMVGPLERLDTALRTLQGDDAGGDGDRRVYGPLHGGSA